MADRFDTHGDFSWCELLTRDVDGSKDFYKQLLGWTMEDVPMQDSSYTILKTDDRPVGGIMKMPPQVPPQAPNHWGSYVTVDDVDAAAKKARQLGAKYSYLRQIRPMPDFVSLKTHTVQSCLSFIIQKNQIKKKWN